MTAPYTETPVEAVADEIPAALVIDDDPALVESLTRMLKDHGFQVLTASNGASALQVFRERSPSLVVTDITMPELDGIGIILKMRRERPDVKIIALAGDGRIVKSDCLTAAEKLGANVALKKGQGNQVVVEVLTKLLLAAV